MSKERKERTLGVRRIVSALPATLALLVFLVGFVASAPLMAQTQPTQPTFSYASNYPTFSVANGDGPFVAGNWNDFAPSVRYGDNSHLMAFVLEQLADEEQYSGKLIPWLATNWTFSDNYHVLTVYLRQGVYFYYNGSYNGTTEVIKWPFTAKDVITTFQIYFKVYGNPFGVTMSSPNPYEVVFNFSTPNIPFAEYTILSGQYIVPWEQYAPLLNSSNPANAVIPVPIGTGPYYVVSQSTSEVVLQRNPIYWIPGRPFIPTIDFYGLYNPQVYAMLAEGKLQWASSGSNGPTSIYGLFIDKNPQYYGAMMGFPNKTGGSNWYLFVNLEKLNYWPWNQTWFRYALGMLANTTELSEVATGFLANGGAPVATTFYLPPILGQSWLNSSVYSAGIVPYNVSGALQIMESHGLKVVNGLLSFPNGTPLPPVTLYMYEDWGDVWAQAYAYAGELKAAGLQVNLVSVSPSTLNSYLEEGNYELAYFYGSGGLTQPFGLWEGQFIPPLVELFQLSNGVYAGNFSTLQDTTFTLPNGTYVGNYTALTVYLKNINQLSSTQLSSASPVYVANLTAVRNGTVLTDYERWVPPQQFINLYIESGETANQTQLSMIASQMAAILEKYVPIVPFTQNEYPFEEWEDQYYVGFSTPQDLYYPNVYVGNANGPSTPILLNIAPRPPGMTDAQMIAYTNAAWHDLLNYLYGVSNTATPQSLLNMLQPTTTTSSPPPTTNTTTTNHTTTPPTTTPPTNTTTTPPTHPGISAAEIAAIVVVVIVVVAVVAVVALRRR
ncbi:hypothetical protein HS1genome_1639 [Sulfodiicoccus acidiphilus]|uniref:Solute-binding protein family 5 domain-containing protein n=1 Tax=Sulfodiicoccus acidiphilus TaxID=1670455 RepID=A0A348B4Z8_9CREN|nr:ABC transporter substrate-binding protein [Sulfodiicoccus acidiphilus]BBD73250.1 hypothetical protein HS1genome_1639 [Sulfodiicoccus acidiphilus]GGT89600.1 hypothetical protein GCM10007116_04310 [Sulfodiicoccus acidiphilus]